MLQGKKTYIAVALLIAASAANYFGYVVPDWAWGLLAAGGFGGVRAALNDLA